MRTVYLKHSMPCLRDQAVTDDIDQAGRDVRLGMANL